MTEIDNSPTSHSELWTPSAEDVTRSGTPIPTLHLDEDARELARNGLVEIHHTFASDIARTATQLLPHETGDGDIFVLQPNPITTISEKRGNITPIEMTG